MLHKSLVGRINVAQRLSRTYWLKACRADGVPTDSKFVEFSPSNPFMLKLNLANTLLGRLLQRRHRQGY